MGSGKCALFLTAAVALCLSGTAEGLLGEQAQAQDATYGPGQQYANNGYLIDEAYPLVDDDFLALMEQEMRQTPEAVADIAARAKELRPYLEATIDQIAVDVAGPGALAGGGAAVSNTAL